MGVTRLGAKALSFFAQNRNYTPGITARLFGSSSPSSPRGASEDPFSARFRQVDRGETTPPADQPGDCSEPTEPDLPQTFVACRCGHLNPLHAVECEQCGLPHPRHLARAIRCTDCGDEDAGPWLIHDGRMVCEGCADRSAA